MQYNKTNSNQNFSLNELISLIDDIFRLKDINNDTYKRKLQIEIECLQKIELDNLITLIDTLHSIYNLENFISLKKDIDQFNSFNPIIERLNFNLEQEFYKKIKCLSNNNFDKALFEAMIKEFYIINEFTFKLRSIFINLLEKHFFSSECMSSDYKNTLKIILDNIKFKYFNDQYVIKSEPIEIEEYIKNNIINSYLNHLIDELIIEILNLSDKALENDIVYAKAMAYQTLLRSLLIILNDYRLLSEYEELYNKLETKDTIAKNIIKSAFISNYSDLSLYDMKKIKENLYEQN